MPKEVTYLIGAGASVHTIPIVSAFSKELEVFLTLLETQEVNDETFKKPFEQLKINKSEVFARYRKDLKWVIDETGKHASIDTYAKKLFLTHNPFGLRKLKAVVDVFLTYLQLTSDVDPRYDPFFATFFQGGLGESVFLPGNVKVLSWNYDFQFELAISPFLRENNSDKTSEFLQTIPSPNVSSINYNKFAVIKLNGTAGGYTYKNDDGKLVYERIPFDSKIFGPKLTTEKKLEILTFLMGVYHHNTIPGSTVSSSILFSWEKILGPPIKFRAFNATKDTSYLVVIGYSFPTFNRDVDREIIQKMPFLEKVYIQIPEKHIGGVVQRFKAINDKVEVIPITEVDTFFVPFEYKPSPVVNPKTSISRK